VAAGAVVWAGHVVSVGRFSPRYPAWQLSLAQMGATAVLQFVVVVPVGLRPSAVAGHSVWVLLILTGVFGSGLAYTLQIVAQQTLTVVRAVVLLAGEAIFSAVFSAVWLGERLSLHQWLGAAGVLVPASGRRRGPPRRCPPRLPIGASRSLEDHLSHPRR